MSVARIVLPLLIAPALVAVAAEPAQAVVVFQTPGTTHRLAFDGLTDASGVPIAGTGALDALVTLRLAATDGLTWRFGYEVENQAGRAFDRARITGFGFDIVGQAPRTVQATGDFDRVRSGLVGGDFQTDWCFMAAGGGCNSNNNSGIRPDDDADGIITLSFANRQQMVELSNLYIRWQGPQVQAAMPPRTDVPAISVGWTDPAPEPAAWAMMITGFGLVGAAARRRTALARKSA